MEVGTGARNTVAAGVLVGRTPTDRVAVEGMSDTGAGESSQASINESSNVSEMDVFNAARSIGLFPRDFFVR